MKKIIVIDDDEGILAAFEALLESVGYSVETYLNSDILNYLPGDKLPDLILLDVLLSGEDGRDVCLKLKSSEFTRGIPVIMISAHPSAIKSILRVGANDFMPKPFEMDELLGKIAQFTA